MDYDPVKDSLIRLFEGSVWMQRLFFGILHLVFLRSWYVRRQLARLLEARPQARVLDAGAGFGQYTDWILRRFPEAQVTAIDIKEDYLERLGTYLRKAGLSARSEVRYGDLVDLAEVGPFDVVLSVDVMEHIEEDVRVFEHFHRVLSPGGAVVINTPSDQGGSGVTTEGGQSFIGEHVRDGYGVDEIRAKLSSAGLDAESIEYGYGKPGTLGWKLLVRAPMELLGRSMLWVPFMALYYVIALPLGVLLNAADLADPQATGTGLTVVARGPG